MVPGGYILLSPQEEEVNYSSRGHRCTHSAAHSSKRFKPLSDMIWLWQGYWWIWKNTNKEFSCVMVFIMRPSNTFIFVSGFNECPWAIFSLHYWIWENFWFYIWVVVVWFLILQHKWLRVTSYPMLMKKNLNAKTTKYIPKCWERSVKRKSNLNFIRAT